MTINTLSINNLKKLYLNKEVHVIYNENGVEIDTRGLVTKVTLDGKLVGTWGPHEITLGNDYVSTSD